MRYWLNTQKTGDSSIAESVAGLLRLLNPLKSELAERVGFENTCKRKFNDIQRGEYPVPQLTVVKVGRPVFLCCRKKYERCWCGATVN
jgi:hypothetical protein